MLITVCHRSGVLFKELLVALPPGHPLTRKRTVSASELDGARLIVMNEGHCLGDQVLGFCDRHDLSHHISFRSAQLETIQSLVRHLVEDRPNDPQHGEPSLPIARL